MKPRQKRAGRLTPHQRGGPRPQVPAHGRAAPPQASADLGEGHALLLQGARLLRPRLVADVCRGEGDGWGHSHGWNWRRVQLTPLRLLLVR